MYIISLSTFQNLRKFQTILTSNFLISTDHPQLPMLFAEAVRGGQQPVLTLSRSVLNSQRYGRQTHSKLPHLRLYLTLLAFQFFPKSVNIAFLGIKFSHNSFKHSVREFPNSLFSESLML